MKILIAENDETSRLLLETTLSRWGHQVVSTKDGQQAYDALLEKDSPKLAVLDWMMPYLDGVEICRKARLDSAIQHLYIVMLTIRNTVEDITEALDSGADDYLNKPFDRRELRARESRSAHASSIYKRPWRIECANSKNQPGARNTCRAFCLYVLTVRKFATITTTGNKSSALLKPGPMWRSATASAQTATRPK